MKTQPNFYKKEERCPIMRNGKVIGHAIMRVSYENDKPTHYSFIQAVIKDIKKPFKKTTNEINVN